MNNNKLYFERLKKKALHDINSEKIDTYDGNLKLSNMELKKISELSLMKHKLLLEHDKVLNILNPLIEEEHKISMKINEINKEICGIEGHKLENNIFITKEYGKTYKCIECGSLIGLDMVSDKDIFVQDRSSKYTRILYKK